jgi:PIN domain nuclease of toxin-antitoxin system
VRLLLDSHAFLWWATGDAELSREAGRLIEEASYLSISLATPWELRIKQQKRRFSLPANIWTQLDEQRVAVLRPELEDVLRAADLPAYHSDPFDRLIIAQAQHWALTVISRDAAFAAYDVRLFPA